MLLYGLASCGQAVGECSGEAWRGADRRGLVRLLGIGSATRVSLSLGLYPKGLFVEDNWLKQLFL